VGTLVRWVVSLTRYCWLFTKVCSRVARFSQFLDGGVMQRIPKVQQISRLLVIAG